MRITVLQHSILFWGFSQQETMYLNRFISSRYQSLVCPVRTKICRFRLIVCQVQVVLELWHITLDQSLIPIIIRWSFNSSLGPWTCFSRKAFTWACAPFDKFCYTELLLQYQSIGNATETLTPVAETIYHTQHVLLPYFFFWKARDGIHMLWLMCLLVFMGSSTYPRHKSDFYVAL
jgi:hypothetical protein